MSKKTKQYSQIFDEGVESEIIAIIGERVFALLVALARFMDENGKCYPRESTLGRILGKSKRTIALWVNKAKKTKYRSEPVLVVDQKRSRENGKWIFGSNHYTVSKSIREDLLSRYYTGSKNLLTENDKEIQGKNDFPQAIIPSSENLLTNDNPSVNNNYINDKKQPLINKFSFGGIPLSGFEEMADTPDKAYCLDIAKWLGEPTMNFILKALNDDKCGMAGIEWAYGRVKEEHHRGTVKNKGKLFNHYVQKYKQDK